MSLTGETPEAPLEKADDRIRDAMAELEARKKAAETMKQELDQPLLRYPRDLPVRYGCTSCSRFLNLYRLQ